MPRSSPSFPVAWGRYRYTREPVKFQNRRSDGFLPSDIVVKAESNLFKLQVLLQHPQHGVLRGAAESDIAVGLPFLRVERNKGHHINGCFKHIEPVRDSRPVKAVPRIAALHILSKGFTLEINTALMRMTYNAVFIFSDEHGVVVFCVLIQQPNVYEAVDNLQVVARCLTR